MRALFVLLLALVAFETRIIDARATPTRSIDERLRHVQVGVVSVAGALALITPIMQVQVNDLRSAVLTLTSAVVDIIEQNETALRAYRRGIQEANDEATPSTAV